MPIQDGSTRHGTQTSVVRSAAAIAACLLLLTGLFDTTRAATSELSAPRNTSEEPNDRFFKDQWGLSRIKAPEAWKLADGTRVTIGILDSGVDLRHPDLRKKLVVFRDADLLTPGSSVGPHDRYFHGTAVAGVAAAITDNRKGIAGVAPGARILPVRVADGNEKHHVPIVARGLRYAVDHGAKVVNVSYALSESQADAHLVSGSLDTLYDAVDYAWERGAVIVAPAGNDSFPLCSHPSAGTRVLCVGAIDRTDSLARSNFDAAMTTEYLVAPGGGGSSCDDLIMTTALRIHPPKCTQTALYDGFGGSTLAAPFVSGVAALLASQGLDNTQIMDTLTASAEDLGVPGRDPLYGYGLVDALAAVRGGLVERQQGRPAGTRPANEGEIQPGAAIKNTAGQYCTLSWVFDGKAARKGDVYVATAAHCTGPGGEAMLVTEPFGEGVLTIGKVALWNYPDDYALIKVDPAHHELVDAALKGHPQFPAGVSSPGRAKEGDLLQFSGHGAGFNLHPFTQEQRVGRLQDVTQFEWSGYGPIVQGDSGGPVANTTDGNKALGIVSGICADCGVVGPTVRHILIDARRKGFPVRLRTV